MEREEVRGSVARAKEAGGGAADRGQEPNLSREPPVWSRDVPEGPSRSLVARGQPRGLTAVDPYHGRARDRWRALLELHAGPVSPIHTKRIMLNRYNGKPVSYPVYCITG